MKKIFLIFFVLLMAQTLVLADEIVDRKGNITPCKIVTVSGGLIEYKKNGCLYKIVRTTNQSVFNDYVDVIPNLSKSKTTIRYSGVILTCDFAGIRIKTSEGDTQIPWYRVTFIGIYNPN